jgi:hypothetical protein
MMSEIDRGDLSHKRQVPDRTGAVIGFGDYELGGDTGMLTFYM